MPDYRNYPEGRVEQMMEDTSAVLTWTIQNIHTYNGNPDKIVVAGISAGAQLTLSVILEEYMKNGRMPTSSSSAINKRAATTATNGSLDSHILNHICIYVGISGPYDLLSLSTHLHKRGMSATVLLDIFCNDLRRFSSTLVINDIIKNRSPKHASPSKQHHDEHNTHASNGYISTRTVKPLADFPPVLLYHGMADKTIPYHICTELANALCEGGAWVRVCLMPEWGHTDSNLEAPMAGDYSMILDIVRYIDELFEDSEGEDWRPSPLGQEREESLHCSSEDNNLGAGTWKLNVVRSADAYDTLSSKAKDTQDRHGHHFKQAIVSLGVQPASARLGERDHFPEKAFAGRWLVNIARPFNPF